MRNMNCKEFTQLVGREPDMDDLERVNCDSAGAIGHSCCGWCFIHSKPKFECLECFESKAA